MPVQPDLTPTLDAAALQVLLDAEFPQLNRGGSAFRVCNVSPGCCELRLVASAEHLRPGGTVGGTALFTLADVGGYACVLSHAGGDVLSVTTSLSINFMRKAAPGPVDARCRILKLGRSLMVFEADITDASGLTVAHAVGTYAIPPRKDRQDNDYGKIIPHS